MATAAAITNRFIESSFQNQPANVCDERMSALQAPAG
jgi:hypothetical protein